jgi:lipopolysaccharide/colanic/teichoic acid biosynthesis glycosyltransferase
MHIERPAETLYPGIDGGPWGLPAPIVGGQQRKHFQMVCKRIIDLAAATVLLAVVAVPMALIALAIKLDSRGPVFHVRGRIGYGGRPFRMYKFRSMVAGADAARGALVDLNETDAPLFKMRHDPRRTRVGQLIRRFSLDELPQLINVVQGHMSLVGPRPALVEEAGDPLSPDHAHRVLAVPGMTGLWQVSGRSLLTFREMVAMDIRYAQEWSIGMDLVILLRTIPVVLRGTGAY